MNGVVHVLDLSTPLPHDQAFYDAEAAREERDLLTDKDHGTSSDMSGMTMSHSGDMVSIRVQAETNRLSGGKRKLAASSGANIPATAHVTAGVGEIASTPGGLQTKFSRAFCDGKDCDSCRGYGGVGEQRSGRAAYDHLRTGASGYV